MERIVVVGASLAGLRAVEALRSEGFGGAVTLIGQEPHAPYDRPPLSKEVLKGEWGAERTALRPQGFGELDVDVRLGVSATGLDTTSRTVQLSTGEPVRYDGLVVATGARPRHLPGPRPSGVFVVRTLDDALALRAAFEKRPRVAVVGAGFIGAEVAASARSLGLDVTLIESLPLPLANKLGDRMGEVCAALHRDNGVDLRLGVNVQSLVGEAKVRGVALSDGTTVDADVVVVGIGVQPNVEWLEGSDVELGDGVECDATCATSAPGVVAAGDVASWHNPLFDERMRVEHWTHAVEQAQHAVRTLLAGPSSAQPFAPAPLFWSDQYGIKIQFAGRARPDDELFICHGTPEQGRFVALYGRAGRLVGVLGFKRPPKVIQYRKRITERADFDEIVAELRAADSGA